MSAFVEVATEARRASEAGADPLRRGIGLAITWVIRVALTLAVTRLIVSRLDISLDDALSVGAELPELSFLALGLSVLALLAGFVFSARLWGWMVAELGGPDPGLVVGSRIFFSANLGRYVPGKVWQVASLAALSRRAGIAGTVAATAGLVGQAFSLLGAGFLSLPVLLQGGAFGQAATVALGGLAMAMVIVSSIPGFLRRALGSVFHIAKLPRESVPEIGGSFGVRWILGYLVNWVMYGSAFYLFVRGLGFQSEVLSVVPPFTAAYVLGYLAFFAPAGLGVREGFLIAFLRPELGAAAVGVAVFARLWMTAVELVPAGGMAVWELLREAPPSEPTNEGPVHRERGKVERGAR